MAPKSPRRRQPTRTDQNNVLEPVRQWILHGATVTSQIIRRILCSPCLVSSKQTLFFQAKLWGVQESRPSRCLKGYPATCDPIGARLVAPTDPLQIASRPPENILPNQNYSARTHAARWYWPVISRHSRWNGYARSRDDTIAIGPSQRSRCPLVASATSSSLLLVV
ncbi:hypothetical protein PLICRDRAFT_209316 [Plicaturopsis crispa FD-325 SS-3]|nr:hypothetical protein PLICRDRAFT_209316 [Plicaturopsis crispa FD-325 SS-3]